MKATWIAGVVVAGVVAGHAPSYLLAFGHLDTQHAVLAETGHGHLPVTAIIAALLGLWGVLGFLMGSARSIDAPGSRNNLFQLALRLAVLQIICFAVLEFGERLVVGAELADLLWHPLLFVGIGVQILTAFLLALILHGLARAVEFIIRSRRSLDHEARIPLLSAGRTYLAPPPRLLGGAWGLRSPPVLLSA